MCLLLLEYVKRTVGSRTDMLILASYLTTSKYRDISMSMIEKHKGKGKKTTVFTLLLQHIYQAAVQSSGKSIFSLLSMIDKSRMNLFLSLRYMLTFFDLVIIQTYDVIILNKKKRRTREDLS